MALSKETVSRKKICVLMSLTSASVLQMRTALEQLQGPQPVDVRLMKKRTGEQYSSEERSSFLSALDL